MKEKVTTKYAFNLAERKKVNIFKNGELDFDNMNKGYFDEIEQHDLNLQQLKKSLENTKSWTVKNLVYANFNIPHVWQNKLTYQDEMMKIINDDPRFFTYLTQSGKNKDQEIQKKTNTHNISNASTLAKSQLEKANTRNESMLKNKSLYEQEKSLQFEKSKSKLFSPEEKVVEDSKEREDTPKNKTNYKKKHHSGRKHFSEKEKREILDHYKEKFKIVKRNPIETDTVTHSMNGAFNGSNLPNISKTDQLGNRTYQTGHRTNSSLVSNLANLTANEKSQMFKSSIYSLLIPEDGKIKLSSMIGKSTSSTVKDKTKSVKEAESEYGPFLHFDYAEYNKKIEIKNPEIKRVLEDINYYGPYFSHCPSCRNKNLEFYQTMDQHNCLNILNFLKKARKNKNVF